jgi:hypothetical protein
MMTMQLVQILLPLFEKGGKKVSRTLLRATARQLAQEFGGITVYARAPAQGFWRRSGAKLDRDDVVVYEVMTKSVDVAFWRKRRRQLEKAFVQDAILVRATLVRRL